MNYGGTQGVVGNAPREGSNLLVSQRVDFAQAGNNLLRVNGHDYTVINRLTELQSMRNNLHGNYALGSSIDASSTARQNDNMGFIPVGAHSAEFTGSFDGLGHTINGLTILRPATSGVGLFGVAQNATLRNVGLEGGQVLGRNYVGSLVGHNLGVGGTASISNVYATGEVRDDDDVGGLAGLTGSLSGNARISAAYATGNVKGEGRVGGLVGRIVSNSDGNTIISNVHATGEARGHESVGGLVGALITSAGGTSRISNAYATGQVEGVEVVGGLVGASYSYEPSSNASISNSYATGNVKGLA